MIAEICSGKLNPGTGLCRFFAFAGGKLSVVLTWSFPFAIVHQVITVTLIRIERYSKLGIHSDFRL